MFKITHCEKRDGRIERFNKNKITAAIYTAFKASGEGNEIIAKEVTNLTLEHLGRIFKEKPPHIEEIQDLVEITLMENQFYKTAKKYIIYRENRKKKREKKRL